MTIQTFNFKVNASTSVDGGFDVNKSKFGDGYAQTVPMGLNNETQTWNVQWAGYKAEAQQVIDFIRAHEGATPFYWKPALAPLGLFTCAKYGYSESGGTHYVINMVFEKGYAP